MKILDRGQGKWNQRIATDCLVVGQPDLLGNAIFRALDRTTGLWPVRAMGITKNDRFLAFARRRHGPEARGTIEFFKLTHY